MRIYECDIIFPIYDLNRNIVNIVTLNSEEAASLSSIQTFVHSKKLFDEEQNTLYITDDLLSLTTIYDQTGLPVILINSENSKLIDHKVILFNFFNYPNNLNKKFLITK